MTTTALISTLQHAVPQTLPNTNEEVSKTLIANFDAGDPYVFFDNLSPSSKVDFSELAAAMTAWPSYQGRRLGYSEMITAKVRSTFIFTGSDKRQLAAIEAFALANGYEIIQTFNDAAVSGRGASSPIH